MEKNSDLSDEELAKRTKLPASQISELREIFRLVDSDGNGSIDTGELHQLLENLKIEIFDADMYINELIGKAKLIHVSTGDSGDDLDEQSFTFEELMLSMLSRTERSYSRKDLQDAFQSVAGRNAEKGYISMDALSRAIYMGAGGMDPEMAVDIMSMVDGQIGGKLHYEEVIDLVMGVEPAASRNRAKSSRKKGR